MLHNITLKVHHYDEDTHQLIVSFGGEQNGIHYETEHLTFNPANYNTSNPDLALRGIAQAGLSYLQREIDKQNFSVSKSMQDTLKGSVNKQFYYISSELNNSEYESMVASEIEI